MTSDIDGPSNQSWQPPSEHPQAPAGIASILVKGSRFMKMERVVRAWAEAASPQGEH